MEGLRKTKNKIIPGILASLTEGIYIKASSSPPSPWHPLLREVLSVQKHGCKQLVAAKC